MLCYINKKRNDEIKLKKIFKIYSGILKFHVRMYLLRLQMIIIIIIVSQETILACCVRSHSYDPWDTTSSRSTFHPRSLWSSRGSLSG